LEILRCPPDEKIVTDSRFSHLTLGAKRRQISCNSTYSVTAGYLAFAVGQLAPDLGLQVILQQRRFEQPKHLK
jgi:hypothetical protein